tara:strand:- start:811 stop:1209 length:399 start_codon:yes stop_codon:yes gene_type:complete
MSKVLDLNSRLTEKRLEAATEQAGGQEQVSEMQAEVDVYREETEEIVNGWINTLLDEMEELDVADESMEFSRDFIFATEAIRSLVYRTRGHGHFIQDVADTMISVSYDEESDMVEGVWNLEVEFEEEEGNDE